MPEKANDKNFPVKIKSSLDEDLLVDTMSGEEQMGQLFVFHLELLSENPELHFDKVVGQQVTVSLSLGEGDRYFNGFITEFRYAGAKNNFNRYHAVIRPWFWFLTQTSDCRIFQEMTVPDIIKSVFSDNGMANFKSLLKGTYRKWEYCVQYRESDFNFISRLMEQEGIYYYFEHQEDKHELVMADDVSAHSAFPKFDTVPFHSQYGEKSDLDVDHLDYWAATQFIKPTKYFIQDFNFKNTNPYLPSKHTQKNYYEMPPSVDPEIFDYPGEYQDTDAGKNYVNIRLEELQCQQERVQAGGTCRGISPGCLFNLEDHPRLDQNKEYLVISVIHNIYNSAFEVTGNQYDEVYRCQLEVMDGSKQFRTPRVTKKPIVQGPQTAIVVGPSDQEIYTDEYGRVKVQFHWDRYGQHDQDSSCWVRVSQLWAGKRWGAMHIPRIGQEVIVSFMEGDPDQPIITGRVYNAVNMPPYELEGNKTQSGIKSRSTSGGGPDNFNEIRMEDKIGSEELYIQAEKNETILVKNDKTENVGNDETISIGHDRVETVGNDETITVGHSRTETVAVDETLTVSNNRTRNVANTETVTIGQFRIHTVGINEDINIGVAQEVIIGGLQAIEVGASQNVGVGLSQSIEVGRDRSLDVGKDYNINVGNDRNVNIGEKESVKVGKDWVVDVGDSVTIKCGSAQIVMKKNGNIQLKGKDITFKASGKMGLKASSAITLKGSSIKEN